MSVPSPTHVAPLSGERPRVFPPSPTAIQVVPSEAAAHPLTEKTVVPWPVHVIPSADVASVFVPSPVAVQMEPFHITLSPFTENTVLPRLYQTVPVYETIIVFVVPSPTAIHLEEPNARPYVAVSKPAYGRDVHVVPASEL